MDFPRKSAIKYFMLQIDLESDVYILRISIELNNTRKKRNKIECLSFPRVFLHKRAEEKLCIFRRKHFTEFSVFVRCCEDSLMEKRIFLRNVSIFFGLIEVNILFAT
jgi:hypothetical protein